MFARSFIDSVEFARHGKEIRGELAVSELPRLADVVAKTEGSLAFLLRGYRDGDNDMLELSLKGNCMLRCQRCLAELEYPVDIKSRLLLLPPDQLEAYEEGDEIDAIEAESRLDVLALVEEELLLGLPFAPRHPDGACSPAVNVSQQKANPFAVLASLKK